MAEGVKISEMEQVSTLEDGCCFPVVSNGVNKKITKKRLWETLITGNSKSYDENFNDGSVIVGYDVTDKKLCIRTIDKVWIYIQNKISSVLGLTKSNYNGTAKTISETLPVEKGGTGATDVKTAHKNIVVSCISQYESKFEDASSVLSASNENVVSRPAVSFWNYIQGKISPTIGNLQNQIDSNKTELQSQIDSNDTDITDLQNQIDSKVNTEDLFPNNSSMTVQATTNTILLNFYKSDGSNVGALEIDPDEENPSINFRLGLSNYLVSTKNMNILIQSAFQEINSLKERVSQLEGK